MNITFLDAWSQFNPWDGWDGKNVFKLNVCSSLGQVKPKTIKLVFAASPLSTQH